MTKGNDVYIVEAVRTPIGKIGGSLAQHYDDQLLAHALESLVKRVDGKVDAVDEVIVGQGKQSTDSPNVARIGLLKAGWSEAIPAYTIHRQCGSGLQAVNSGAQQIMSQLADVVVAGGVESMSTAPYYLRGARFGLGAGNGVLLDPNTESQPRSQPKEQYGEFTMGFTAETLAEKYKISREDQDRFAYSSQKKAAHAIEEERFQSQIAPVEVKQKKHTLLFSDDEHPRLAPIEKLATLQPVFKTGGTVTAGNSSGRNDGAAAILLTSQTGLTQLSVKPRAKIIAQAAAGVSPKEMGLGPVPATAKALKQVGLTFKDIDVIELNEAFSAQALAVLQEWGMDMDDERLNPNGGAIALGHPIGASGAILLTKALYELERRQGTYALITLCIAGGLGISTIIERVS
ncbi:acetyl-CoA C-acyltransferase [Shouchella sp. JSM 1781072]|uniref:thiolase family protein n=1 Tax=Bacillaceae TaxID=186817 RepID=UPI000C0841C5|nr:MULTISPECIES: thiolase family protein [Bacillaceae]UTR05818.1 thiolase family protein [Alkalihalobacillus sp. LMS6]